MNKKLVSIIIPTYNRGNLIKETINSVLYQTYKNYEIIVIDDGSNDKTKEIIHKFKDSRIKYIWQEHSGIPAVPRNRGLNISKGEYIAFLDSDDLWLPKKLEKQIKAFEKFPDILLVSTNVILFRDNLLYKFLSIKEDKRLSFRELLKNNIVASSSVLMRRSTYEKIGIQDEDISIRAMEDYDYWLRILRSNDKSILILKEVLIKYRLHDARISENKKKPIYLFNKYKKISQIFEKFKDYDQNYLDTILRNLLYQYRIIKTKEALLRNRISIFHFLKDKNIKNKDKLILSLNYFSGNYLKKSFFFIDLVKTVFHYYIFRLLKSLRI